MLCMGFALLPADEQTQQNSGELPEHDAKH